MCSKWPKLSKKDERETCGKLMSKVIELPKNDVEFPPVCVVCGAYAAKKYPLNELFVYGVGGKMLVRENK